MSVDFSIEGSTAIVVLSAPEKLNAIDLETRARLENIWAEIARSKHIRAVILTGAGERAFCAGVDLKSKAAGSDPALASLNDNGPRSLTASMQIPQPIICAVNGFALGGGMEMALASDIVIAAQHAQFALTEVKLGSLPGAGGTQFLPRITSRSNAMLYLLTGDRMSAEEALRLGVVSKLCASSALMDLAHDIAQRIALNAPLSVAAIKKLVSKSGAMPSDEAVLMERLAFGVLSKSADRAEGRAAFRENRQPNFIGE